MGRKVLFVPFVVFWFLSIMTVAAFAQSAEPAGVDRVVVSKAKKLLMLMKGDQVIRKYRIALGKNPLGHKERRGDSRTPEGEYVLDWRNPRSRFHRSIHISYPNENDVANARRIGVSPGGNIMIHGLPNDMAWLGFVHAYVDWTDGCIAVTNEEIEEIWEQVQDGTPIQIRS